MYFKANKSTKRKLDWDKFWLLGMDLLLTGRLTLGKPIGLFGVKLTCVYEEEIGQNDS